jgi:predicted nucleic acid-binding protein
MNVIDSSLWLEYFAGTDAGHKVSAQISDAASLVVPSITLYEVFKKLLIESGEGSALFAVAHMKQGTVVDLTAELAFAAAKLSRDRHLPMADSIIYATTQRYDCTLWTQDKHFAGLESVRYFEKQFL